MLISKEMKCMYCKSDTFPPILFQQSKNKIVLTFLSTIRAGYISCLTEHWMGLRLDWLFTEGALFNYYIWRWNFVVCLQNFYIKFCLKIFKVFNQVPSKQMYQYNHEDHCLISRLQIKEIFIVVKSWFRYIFLILVKSDFWLL